MTPKCLNSWQVRWALFFGRFSWEFQLQTMIPSYHLPYHPITGDSGLCLSSPAGPPRLVAIKLWFSLTLCILMFSSGPIPQIWHVSLVWTIMSLYCGSASAGTLWRNTSGSSSLPARSVQTVAAQQEFLSMHYNQTHRRIHGGWSTELWAKLIHQALFF